MNETKKSPAIIFDFGGVLVDWNPYLLYRKVMKDDQEIKDFLDEIDFKNWNPIFDRGYSFEKGVEEKCAEYPHRTELLHRFKTHWLDSMGEVNLDTVEVVRKLKAAGYPLYGLSNWSAFTFKWVKDGFPFLQYLDDYLLSGEVQQVKPEPDIFHTFLKRIGWKAQDCLFIDDSEANSKTANTLGMQTIRFTTASQLVDELSQMGILLN